MFLIYDSEWDCANKKMKCRRIAACDQILFIRFLITHARNILETMFVRPAKCRLK